MYRLWLTFAQTATVCLAILFVVATLKPEWLPGKPAVPLEVNQAAPAEAAGAAAGPPPTAMRCARPRRPW